MTYLINLPGLANAIERAPVAPKHAVLIAALRQFEPLANVKFATMRDGITLMRRKVLNAAGDVVAEDHRTWLAQEVEKDRGLFRVTADRLRYLEYRLSECAIEALYLIADRGGEQDNFLQIEVNVKRERVDRRMFDHRGGSWRRLEDLDDLVRLAEDEGDRVFEDERVLVGKDHYELERCIDVAAFMLEAEAFKTAEHVGQRHRTIAVTDMEVGPGARPPVQRQMTLEEINPAVRNWKWPARRLFDDWAASSAGRAGHRLCDHWAMQITDYTSPEGRRDFALIPLWTHTRKMARIESAPNVDALFGKLQSIDARRGADFAWFFYMLHGNLVSSWAGERILKAAEQGIIELPEHDYQILRRWDTIGYGF